MIIFLPVIGAIVYFIVRSRDVLEVVTAPELSRSVPEVGHQLEALSKLPDAGTPTSEEFERAKAKLLG